MSQQPDSSSTTAAIPSFNITLSSSQSPQQPNLLTAAPPPRSRALQLQPNNNNSSSTSSLFIRRLILAIVLLFVFISVVHFLAWRILHPLPPVFEVNSFHISIGAAPRSMPNADYNYTIEFTITNPNKKLSLLLDHFEVLVFEGKRETTASREWMHTTVPLNKNPEDFPVRGSVPKHVNSSLRNKREVTFNVRMNFRTKFLASNWLSKRDLMAAYCRDLSVRFLPEKNTGNFTGKKGKCLVHPAF